MSENENMAIFQDIWLYAKTDVPKSHLSLMEKMTKTSKLISKNVEHKNGVNQEFYSNDFEDVKYLINGIGRIITYEVHKPKGLNSEYFRFDPYHDYHLNKIIKMEEGEFKRGKCHGLCRIIS